MRNLTMMTDLYQLTMMQGYFNSKTYEKKACFDVFFRDSGDSHYAVFAGLEQAIDYIKNLRFTEEDVEYLRSLNEFTEDFLSFLLNLKFTGDIYSVEEGTVVFPQEPIFIVEAPIIQAQLVETAILNILNHQTLIATKANKISNSAKGPVMEFGLRRAQGPDAGIYGARAAIIGGCSSTSNVYAGQKFGVKISGTHSHSWVMSFPDEITAFREYAKSYPEKCLFLVDTYDTIKSGVPNAIKVFDELKAKGIKPLGIRIDSGDLAYLSKVSRKMLDEAGYKDTIICVSGDLDENSIQSLKLQGAKIDLWGVGTRLITSHTNPSLGGVYKMCAVEEEEGFVPKIKISNNPSKMTNPGLKTIYRFYDKDTNMALADLISLRDEKFDENQALTIFHPIETWKKMTLTNFKIRKLLVQIFKDGEQVYQIPDFNDIINYAKTEVETFWEEYKRVEVPHIYKVDLSEKLYNLKKKMLGEINNY